MRALTALVVTAGSAVQPVTALAATGVPCHVRNVSQDTHGTSFAVMVAAALPDDLLLVRGVCTGGAVIAIPLTIRGAGTDPTLTGRDRSRVIKVTKDARVIIDGLRITHGRTASTWGGGGAINWGSLTLIRTTFARNGEWGITNRGSMVIVDSVVQRNTGMGLWNDGSLDISGSRFVRNAGTGIHNYGTMTLADSVVRGNREATDGGGLFNGGTATVLRTVIAGNTAGLGGGGVFNGDEGCCGILVLRASRVSGNTAGGSGGGIYGYTGTITLSRSSVTDNAADWGGGGIHLRWARLRLDEASSVTGNTPHDCVHSSAC